MAKPTEFSAELAAPEWDWARGIKPPLKTGAAQILPDTSDENESPFCEQLATTLIAQERPITAYYAGPPEREGGNTDGYYRACICFADDYQVIDVVAGETGPEMKSAKAAQIATEAALTRMWAEGKVRLVPASQ